MANRALKESGAVKMVAPKGPSEPACKTCKDTKRVRYTEPQRKIPTMGPCSCVKV